MDNYNDSDMDLEDSDGDVVFDADLLLEATKSNVQNWILIHDDKGFTGCAKVFTYAPNNQNMNIIIKLVRMPEGPMSEGGGMLTIELADCSGIEVRSENHFVVAPNSGLEVEGGSYGAVFVLGPTSKKTFDGMELGDESPLLDMLVEGKGEWHSIHAPPHEYLAMHPYAVAMKHPEGEVYRYQGLVVKLVKATSSGAFEAEVKSGIQMRNRNALGFAKLLGYKRNFDPPHGNNQSAFNAIVYGDVGRFSLRTAIICRGMALPYCDVKVEPKAIDDLFAQVLNILVHLHADGGCSHCDLDLENVIFSVGTNDQFNTTLTDCRNAVYGKDMKGLSPLPEKFDIGRCDPMLRIKKMVGRTRRKRKDPSDGLIDLFEIDLYTWARMVSEYRGWSIGPRDNFNEPDEIEDRDEDLVELVTHALSTVAGERWSEEDVANCGFYKNWCQTTNCRVPKMTPEKLAELDQFRAQALATTGPAFATGPSFNSSNGTSPPAGAIAVGASVMAGPVAGDPVEQLGNLEGGEEQMTMAGAPAQSGSGARAETGGGEVTGGTSRKRSQTQDNEQHNVERRSKRPVVQGRGADAPRAPAPASGRSQRVVNQQGGSMGVGPSLRRSRRLQELQEGIGGAPSSSTTAGATSRKRTQRTEEAELQHKRPRKGGGGAVEASRVVPRGGRATARRTTVAAATENDDQGAVNVAAARNEGMGSANTGSTGGGVRRSTRIRRRPDFLS